MTPAEERLVEAGLELVRHEENLALVAFKGFSKEVALGPGEQLEQFEYGLCLDLNI